MLRMTRRTTRRARGQALVEFALVAPIFFITILVALQLFTWAYDKQVLSRAVRIGATAGNEAMAPVNFRFALDPVLATVYEPGLTDLVFTPLPGTAETCRKAANTNNSTVAARLGWDWGCVYDPLTGQEAGKTLAAADATRSLHHVLDYAARSSFVELKKRYLGPMSGGYIDACFATWNGTRPVCTLGIRLGFDGSAAGNLIEQTWTVRSAIDNPTTARAPSFLLLTIHVNSFDFDRADIFALDGSTVQVLNRFIVSCKAPADTGDFTAGSCGNTY